MAKKTQPIRHADPLLTVGEVLAELRVARSTFDTWRALGTAPTCIKLPNGQLRVSRSALDSWLNAQIEAAEVA
jgi:predicted DNA-binding transcriptional regulator AlpA